MNKLFLLLTCLLFLSFQSDAQEEEYSYIDVKWKVGDSKVIAQIDSSIVSDTEKVIMSTITNSTYSIRIVSQTDSTYEVSFRQIKLDPAIKVESELIVLEELQKAIEETLSEFQKKLADYEYIFIVDKSSASAVDIKDVDKLLEMLTAVTNTAVDFYIRNAELEGELRFSREELQVKVEEYLNEKTDDVLGTMINAFNYIFQAYSSPYVDGKTITMDAELFDIDQVKFGDLEPSKGKLHITGKSKGNLLTIDTEYDYDKRTVYEQMVVAEGKEAEIPMEEFELSEHVISEFDTKTSWLKKNTSIVKVKLKNIKVYNATRLEIK